MGKINGKLWRVYLINGGNTAIPLGTSENFSVENAVIDASDKDSGGWQENIDGQRSWSGGSTANYDQDQAEQISLIDGLIDADVSTQQTLGFGLDNAVGDIMFTGDALIAGASFSADNEALVTVDFTFTGTGALTKVTKA